MRITTINTNGINSATRKGFEDYIADTQPDVVCIQELKSSDGNAPAFPAGYEGEYHYAQRKGYSGVGLLFKRAPDNLQVGLGIQRFDDEGRFLRADFGNLTVISVYVPSASYKTAERLPYKMDFLDELSRVTADLQAQGRDLVICGDYNIAHKRIDLARDKANEKKSGFLPEERAWIDQFIDQGMVDSQRQFAGDEEVIYSWWSLRSNARERNVGWRLDYHFTTPEMYERLRDIRVDTGPILSDHAPVVGDYDYDI